MLPKVALAAICLFCLTACSSAPWHRAQDGWHTFVVPGAPELRLSTFYGEETLSAPARPLHLRF
jgi:hypothetical protein